MTTDDLLNFAEHKGYDVIYYPLPETKSLSYESSNCYIGLDTSLFGIEEKECLAHEIGHCECGGFYDIGSKYQDRRKIEYRARKWAFLKILPLTDIKKAFRDGYREPWELAELFDVSVEFISNALKYYCAVGALYDILSEELSA